MSGILKSNILSTGQLEQQIFDAFNPLGCGNFPSITETDPCESQREFSKRLANAISEAVAKGVQQYLASTVKTINRPTLTNTDSVVPSHIHPNVPVFDLQAP